ncbi:MAG: TolC family protein [Candidatus Omnitrophica bacterium]|nr:TolC family protein [Candidatus Omnitrophota bacterium]
MIPRGLSLLRLSLLVGFLGSEFPPAHGQTQFAQRVVDLESTIKRVVETDPTVLRHDAEYLVDEARIGEIRASDGWELELRGDKEVVQGDRSNVRDSSRGRDPRAIRGELEEEEQSLRIGLAREFLQSPRKQRADVVTERLKQLDRTESLLLAANRAALTAGLAYLDVYYGKDLSAMLQAQVAFEEETLRVLNTRLELYEALRLDVLTTEVSLSSLRKRLADEEMKDLRKLQMLREIWRDPTLTAESLSPPEVVDASALELSGPESLLEEAWSRRPDLAANRAALSTLQMGASTVEKLPEFELGVAGRFREHDRDFADSLREDSTFDVLMEFSLKIPLSLRRENAFRRQQHGLNVKSRGLEIESRRRFIAINIRQAHEDYKAACSELRIRDLTTKRFLEAERITRLTVETMPEMVVGNPDVEMRKATNAVLEARADLVRARRLRMETLLTLLAELGRLAPAAPTLTPAFRTN